MLRIEKDPKAFWDSQHDVGENGSQVLVLPRG